MNIHTKGIAMGNYKALLGFMLIILASLSSPITVQANEFKELPMNGLASYVQLRKEYYIGALYLQTLSPDAESIRSMPGKKRLEMRITIDKWSRRRFAQQWNQAILINNDQDTLEKFADQILDFTQLAQKDLVAGDHIVINMDPQLGTYVYLNQHRMMKVADNAFFNLLLNTWIGSRPPSSEFKNNILTLSTGQDFTNQLVSYNALAPTTARKQAVADWAKSLPSNVISQQQQNETEKTVAKASNIKKAKSSAEKNSKPATKPKKIATAKPATVKKTATPTNKTSTANSKPKASAPVIAKPAVQPKTAAKVLAEAAAAPTPETKKPAVKAKNIAKAPPKPKESKEQLEQKNLLKVYRSNVLKLAYLNTQYPERAMNLKQEGLVVMKVTVNRKGKVIDLVEETSSEHRLLNRAAQKAIKKTAPFPDVPDGLKGKEIVLKLPFNFKL